MEKNTEKKINCKYCDLCWRLSYSKYLQEHRRYKDNSPPTRLQLVFLGYCSPKQAMTKKDSKHLQGIWCSVLPQPGLIETYCPELIFGQHENCADYKRELEKEKRREEKQKSYLKFNPCSTKFSKIDKVTRQEVAQRDKYTCVYCRRHLHIIKAAGHIASIDHIIPQSKGGGHNQENLAFCCSWCNSRKQDKIWEFGCMEGKI